jgi:hypothetical protein
MMAVVGVLTMHFNTRQGPPLYGSSTCSGSAGSNVRTPSQHLHMNACISWVQWQLEQDQVRVMVNALALKACSEGCHGQVWLGLAGEHVHKRT